ncbi:testican-3-like isoform X1 [Lampetra planeri]
MMHWAAVACVLLLAVGLACGEMPRSDQLAGGNFVEEGPWNRFRDEDYFRSWEQAKPFDQGLDPSKDPCRNVKCSRRKVCVARDYSSASCVSRKRLVHSMKHTKVAQRPAEPAEGPGGCKSCPVVRPSPVCGTDGHTYSSQCKLEYQACVTRKQMAVKCATSCPCHTENSTPSTSDKDVCSDRELTDMASRLKDWFRVLHQQAVTNAARETGGHAQPTDPTAFDTSMLPICRDHVGWMFNRLDSNHDLFLDQGELSTMGLGRGVAGGLESPERHEPCLSTFLDKCDTYSDSLLSNNEWCFCFQRQKPPCHAEKEKLQHSKKLVGGFIPTCDEQGYYGPKQCHGSTGQCWCVDQYGKETPGTRLHGEPSCGERKTEEITASEEEEEVEGSGDLGSGDVAEWTDDDDEDDDDDDDDVDGNEDDRNEKENEGVGGKPEAEDLTKMKVAGREREQEKEVEVEPEEDPDDEDESDDGYVW